MQLPLTNTEPEQEDYVHASQHQMGRLGVVAVGLLAASFATAVSAQPGRDLGRDDICPVGGMMGAGGPAFGSMPMHDAVASALGLTSQELWEAQAAGKSIGTLAQKKR